MARPDNWVPLCKRDHINVLWIVAICANQLTMNFIWTPIGALTNPYCQKLKLNNVATTLVQLIGSVVGIIVPPLAAVWSDTTTAKFGRRRVWMIGGEVLVIVGLMMVSFCRELTGHKRSPAVAVFVIGQILASVGGNTANGPGRSMCSDVVPASQQVLVSNICTLYGGLAGVISNMIGALKLYQYTSLNNETLVLMISCIIGVCALVISVCATPEEPLLEKPETTNPFSLILQSFKEMTRQTWFLVMGFFCFQLGVAMFGWQNANYIATKVFRGNAQAPEGSEPYKTYDNGISHAQLLALIQTIIQVAYSFVNTPIVNAIGLRNAWFVGMITAIIADIIFLFKTNKWFYIIAYISMGISQVVANSCPYALVTLITPPEKLAIALTNVIFFGNIAGVFAQFGLNMGLGSIGWFSSNTGRLIAIPFVFEVLAFLCGFSAYQVTGKQMENLSESSGNDDESSEDKPAAL
ncbi:hypothetical protein M9Y10_044886 [Tritrichomonas musculus]|uniref:Major facilitator superfamily transporter n=1 Tax=Tritrichomonas musculus TaxID=1915356 RepID=A0ABR2JTN1_9EUKA